jgi:DNA-binding MarR family transcriptional regulator
MSDRERPEPADVNGLEKDFPVSYSIYAMSRVQRAIATPKLAGLGLFPAQEIMLMQLSELDGQSQKALARSMRISHVTVAKMLARMERAGLVRRENSTTDRRVTLAYLTDAGRDVQQGIRQVWTELEAITNKELDDQTRKSYLAAVAKIRHSLDTEATPNDLGAGETAATDD